MMERPTEHITSETVVNCHHCGESCTSRPINFDSHFFCCQGCRTVYDILQKNGLCTYYDLNDNAGVSLKAKNFANKYDYLSEPAIQDQLLQFKSGQLNKITFYIPAVHCSSCVWLLENFKKIRQGVLASRLNFIKKELSISYDPTAVSLKEIVELLCTLGYEPQINLQSGDRSVAVTGANHSLIIRIGVVGFCFGNIMLLSFPEYFNMDLENLVDAQYQRFFLYLNFLLALPVFFFGASDYLKGAWQSLKQFFAGQSGEMSIDIPIALGVTALFGRSLFETFVNQEAGYWDSMAGLVFFLLLGKWVQQATFNFLSFERNYKSYFPLAVEVKKDWGTTYRNVNDLKKTDCILIHNQEIVPADAILLSNDAQIDYSFVTGESDPQRVNKGELVYAGGRQVGQRIELSVEKPVAQSYLTQLWNDGAFDKDKTVPPTKLANLFSKYFTFITLGIAFATAIFWWFVDPSRIWISSTAVLMVACPCALTLSMPFTMNAVTGIFGRNKFYVKNQGVVQLMNEIDVIVFDKTGTLTESKTDGLTFIGDRLTDEEKRMIWQVTGNSTHPLSKAIANQLAERTDETARLTIFEEIRGKGISATINDTKIKIGSADFVGVKSLKRAETAVHILMNDVYKGRFEMTPNYRKNWQQILQNLAKSFKLVLLSGDNENATKDLAPFFGSDNLLFKQKPDDKLDQIKRLQCTGQKVMMIGDGLNDAGALKKSEIGIAISEDAHAFSPACDAILQAGQFQKLTDFIDFGRKSVRIVKASFILSLVYNIICIGWAMTGNLSPIFAAIFMPFSTISVVLFAVGTTYWFAFRKGLLSAEKDFSTT